MRYCLGDKNNTNVLLKKKDVFIKKKEGTITKLHIVSNSIFVETNNGIRGFDTNIVLVDKIKKPLFTTEDGVNMYEGDHYFTVNFTRNYPSDKIDIGIIRKSFIKNASYKYFSAKKAAEEYILMNKPCLSINDVLHCIPKLSPRLLSIIKGFVKIKKL